MAQLKDSVVSGNLRVSDTTLSATVQLTTLRAPTTSGGATYGPGTSGQVLKSNGTSSYWAADSNSDVNVTQTATSTDANYEVLFSNTADNTTRTEGARKNSNLIFNPSTGTLRATLVYAGGAESQSTYPAGGYHVYDCRSVTVTPAMIGKTANFYFHMTGTPDTSRWWSIMHVEGWAGGYSAWEIAGPSHNVDQRTTPLYVRTSNGGTAWGSWRKIYDTANKPTAADVGVSFTQTLSSGTKIGTITLDGTSTDLYCQTNTNTDTKVTQTATSTSDFRPIVLGYTHSTTPGDLAPSTAPTDQVYVTSKLYMKPTTGDLYTDGTITITTSGCGLKLTDSDGNAYAAIWDNGYNLWIGAGQAETTHHVGQTFISAGYDSTNSIGYGTIRISVPNATNDGATNYYALHDGNTSATASVSSSATGAYQIGTITIRNTTTTLYGINTNTWTAMVGATSSANGSVGYINSTPPKDGYNTKFWRADGSWAVPTNTTYGLSGAYGSGNNTWITTLTAGGSGTTSTVPTASTSVYGITKLSDSTSSTSTALAATANSVKTAYDLANGKSVVTASTSTVSGATTIKSIKIDNTNYNIYDSGNTDTKVNVKLATTTKAYLLATSTTPTSSDQAVTSLADTGVYLSTTAGEIVATNFSGKINNHTVGADVPATAVFTDEKVKQTATSTSDFRPVVFGTTHSTTPGDLAPSTAPVDQVYVTPSFYMQPSTGKLYAKSKIYFDNATFDTSTTPATVTTEAAGLYAYDETGYRYQLIIENTHNLWIGAGQTNGQHHTGETYISAGYDKANSVGFSTIKISVPNATNDGATNYSVWHSGNLTPYTHPTYTAQSTAAIYAITRDATGHIGSIATPSAAQVSTIINQLSEGSSNPQLADYYVAQYAGGGSTTKTYHRRPISALWNTLKALITATTTGSGNAITSVSLADDGNNRKFTFTKGTTFSTTDENVKQTATSTSANYEVLFSSTADNTTRTEGARKNNNLTFNPSTGTLSATNFVGTVNSYSIGASVPSAAVFTDANVTQTELALDASYEVLFAGTADNTTRTEGAGKSSAVTLNPSSGNLTTTGAFVLKEGSYTGTITQNTLAANRTWTFPKHASGIIHIEQRANFYDDTASVASTPWQKVASLTTGAASTDRTATFIVAANYSGDVDKKFGIVQCHLRTNGSKVFSSAELTWLYKSPQLFLSDIVLLYKSVANTNTTIEIWAKSIRRYSGYTFTLLDEHDRKGVISGQWELTTNNGAAGSASLPTGFTSKNSRILSNGTTLFDGTVSSSTVPDPSVPLQYAITNADYDWQSFSMLIMCIQTSTANNIDEWTNIVIPWQLFCSDVTTQYYVPKGISDLSSAAALMRHPTNIGQGLVIDVTRGSWSGSKRVVLIGIQ